MAAPTPTVRASVRAPTAESSHPRSSRRIALLLFAVLVCVYLSNLRFIYTGDTAATRYVPFSVLMRGRLDVDPWIGPYLRVYREGKVPWGVYFASESRGHWMSTYPVLTPLLVTPLYVPAALWLKRQPVAPTPEQMQFYAEAMEKLSAAIIAALSAAILYLALRKIAPAGATLAITAIYALASPTWNIGSQTLWTHGVTELSFALLLWALVSDRGDGRGAAWIGLALALAMANKPTNAVVAAPVIIYVLWRKRERWLPFFAPMVILGALDLGYNLYFFNNPFGGYSAAFQNAGYGGVGDAFDGNMVGGAAGLLISPSRGALWFYPWIVFAIWGAARMWKQNQWPWSRFVVAGAALFFLTYAKVGHWYGGYCFGPRYLTDIMPCAALFLLPLWPTFEQRRPVRAVLALTVALAFGVQILGAFFYPNGEWNETPVSVDVQPARLWDWSDPQIVRVLRAGPAHGKLAQHLRGDHRLE